MTGAGLVIRSKPDDPEKYLVVGDSNRGSQIEMSLRVRRQNGCRF